jgi:hypothetical protein
MQAEEECYYRGQGRIIRKHFKDEGYVWSYVSWHLLIKEKADYI